MKLWKQENAEFFLQNFDSSKLPQINQMLDGLNLQMHVSKSDIDDVNSQIENLFHSACINTFDMTKPKKNIVKNLTNHGLMLNADQPEISIIKRGGYIIVSKLITIKTCKKLLVKIISKLFQKIYGDIKNTTIEKLRRVKSKLAYNK